MHLIITSLFYTVCSEILNLSGHVWSFNPSQDIDSQLRTAAQAFLENDDGCVVDSGNGEVKLSQIFKWYKADFGGTDESVGLAPPTWTLNADHNNLFFQWHKNI